MFLSLVSAIWFPELGFLTVVSLVWFPELRVPAFGFLEFGVLILVVCVCVPAFWFPALGLLNWIPCAWFCKCGLLCLVS